MFQSFTRSRFWRLGFIIISMFGIVGSVQLFFIRSQYSKKATKPADCVVIFGAAVWKHDQPSHALYDRVISAIDVAQTQKITCFVLSGGNSTYGAHEVTVMKNMIHDAQLQNTILIEDYTGNNTLQTIKNLDKTKSYIMVSNDFHLARIKFLAWRENLPNISLHAATYHHGRYVKNTYFIFREILGLNYYGLYLDRIPFLQKLSD